LSGDNTGVTVVAGTNTGTVVVEATTGSNTCFTVPLDLVDCSAGCGGNCSGGGLNVSEGSVDIKLGMGGSLRGGSAGYVRIRETSPTNTIASIKGLHYDFRRADVQVFTNSAGLLTQIKAAQQIANIISNAASSYSIQLFTLTNIVGATNGGYQLTGSPFQTVTITNLNGDTNLVRVIDSNDGSVYDYSWQTNGWLLTTGNGLRNELKTTTYDISATYATNTTTIYTGANPAVFSKLEVWQSFSTNGQRLIQEITGTASNTRSNTYWYTANGYLQQVQRWDGTWEYYIYDDSNRPTNIFRGFLNQGVTTNRSLCRLTEYNYSSSVVSGSGDSGNTYFLTPRRTIEYLQNVEVSRKYFVALSAERREIQCTVTGAAWNAAGNLVTDSKLFTNGLHMNEPWVIANPDGTGEAFGYSAVGQTITNTVLRGHIDASGTNVDSGSKTVTILTLASLPLSETVSDIESGIVTSQETYAYDTLNRRTNTTFLDGTSLQTAYDCCTVTSQTDRDGTVTAFTHDALKRLLTTTVNSITISNAYDPAGNTLAVVRYGSDSTVMTNSQATFNDAGEQTGSVDALGNSTTHTNYFDGSGQLVRKTVYADLGTRLETSYNDGSAQSTTGTAVFPTSYLYGVDADGTFTVDRKLDSVGGTNEWTKTSTDAAGRQFKTVYAAASGTPTALSYFNSAGQRTNQIDPDGVSQIFAFNQRGEPSYTVLDSNRNSTIDFIGDDRITLVTNDVVSSHGTYVRRSQTFVWSASSNASNLLTTTETCVDGLQSWSTIWNNGLAMTSHSQTTCDPANGYRIVTNTAPDASYTVETNQYGRLISLTSRDSSGAQISRTVYGYDAHGRNNTIADARNGTATNWFNAADKNTGTKTPSPDGTATGLITTNVFDSMLRIAATKLPDNTWVTNKFDVTGLLTNTFGSRTYPVCYTFDVQGRMKTMTTWTNYATSSGAATTTWNYDAYRGWLSGKSYPDSTGPSYAYSLAGRLQTRTWARGTNTTYTINNAGDTAAVSYNDGSTPTVSYQFDRRGRQTGITNGTSTCLLTLNDPGNVLVENNVAGILSGISLTNGFDQYLRRTNLVVLNGSTVLVSNSFLFDAASRLNAVSDGTNSATYGYVANSPLVSQILFTNSGALRMTTTKQYDFLNRPTNVSSSSSIFTSSFAYGLNSASQRTSVTNADGTYWIYTYDSLGQVTSGKKYWSDGTPVAGQQFEYTFDDIGNRRSAGTGGDQTGSNLRYQTYTPNNLNQYTSRTVPGYFDILGSAASNATVTIWTDSNNFVQPYRHGEYFRGQLQFTNSSSSVWASISNVAVLPNGTNADIVSAIGGNVFLPQSPELFGYDRDGNMTNDGRWSISWDAENRITSFTSLASTPASSRLKIDCTYDYRWRRTQKVVSAWNGSSYVPQSTSRFVYDGWNLVAILDGTNGLASFFMWGLDASGTPQGARGVGGALLIGIATGINTGSYLYAYDANSNVKATISATTGAPSAQYEYSSFGELLEVTGVLAVANPILFSTKYYDTEASVYCYPYRYYSPSLGRWLSRDLSDIRHEPNHLAFVCNAPLNSIDPDGRETYNLDKDTYYRAINFQVGDIVIAGGSKYVIQSGNIAPFKAGTPPAKLVCLLKKLGFLLPAPPFPVYLADFDNAGYAWTISYGILPKKWPTLLNKQSIELLNTVNAELQVVTLWHEIKGHQIDNGDDGPAFDQKYEAPVKAAIDKLKARKLPKDLCSTCVPAVGPPYAIQNDLDKAMCACGISRPPKSK
jgi:RHS repeat-associated protein